MMRLLRWLLIWMIVTVDPASAQTALAPMVLGIEAPSPRDAIAVVTPARNAAGGGFGWSGALNIVLAPAAAEIQSGLLARFGGGWETGHRWSRFESRVSRILGEPVGQPEQTPASVVRSVDAADPPMETHHVVAPSEPGVWQLESGTGTVLTVITQVPATAARGGRLNGYHIGTYPTAGSDRTDAYAPPTAFIEITPDNKDLRVSSHLTFAQFLTKDQFDFWPKYLALDLRLIDKLELVIQELQLMGIRAERMHVMSGFRTPQYNGPGGDGRATLSRHMWGDAADVWIDNVGDGQMDDLNGDGRIDIDDAAVILRAVERVEQKYPELIGGAGTYPTTPAHGPYIHIDARGYHSRW